MNTGTKKMAQTIATDWHFLGCHQFGGLSTSIFGGKHLEKKHIFPPWCIPGHHSF